MTAGTALGSPITGLFVDNVGSDFAFIAIGVMASVVVLLALLAQQIRRRVRRVQIRRRENVA